MLDMRRPSRYPVRVAGDALTTRGILHGDILIADAATPPIAGRIAIVMLAGDVLVALRRRPNPGRADQRGCGDLGDCDRPGPHLRIAARDDADIRVD
ncbi:MAG: hypothetical protein POG24_11980 [Acidocella sp.]|nr:hypothetical protein [Acidocella sp.]